MPIISSIAHKTNSLAIPGPLGRWNVAVFPLQYLVPEVFWHGELFQETLGAHMATYLNSTVLWYKSCRLCLLYVIFFVIHACRNRFIQVILYPVLTAQFYFLIWISLFLSLEVISHQHILGKIFQICIDILSCQVDFYGFWFCICGWKWWW